MKEFVSLLICSVECRLINALSIVQRDSSFLSASRTNSCPLSQSPGTI